MQPLPMLKVSFLRNYIAHLIKKIPTAFLTTLFLNWKAALLLYLQVVFHMRQINLISLCGASSPCRRSPREGQSVKGRAEPAERQEPWWVATPPDGSGCMNDPLVELLVFAF